MLRRLSWLTEDDGSPDSRLRIDLLFALLIVPATCLLFVGLGASWSRVMPIMLVWGGGGMLIAAVRYAVRKRMRTRE